VRGREKKEIHSGIYRGNLKERAHLEDLGIDGRIVLKWIFRQSEGNNN